MTVSFGRLSSPTRQTLHLDFQMYHNMIEAMVGKVSLNLIEHQICNSLTGFIVHLFLCTQNTFNLPRCLDIQAFFSNLQHSANPKDMEPSIPLFISISSLSTKLPVHESIPISNVLDFSPEEHNMHFPINSPFLQPSAYWKRSVPT